MSSTNVNDSHIAITIQSITQLRADHHQSATRLERWVDRMTAHLGRLRFLGVLTGIIGGWIGLNLLLPMFGRSALDPPPFVSLTTAATFLSLYIAVLILASQRRADQLAQHSEHLNLELAILSEQKTAKVIELLEESRRDNPLIRNRVDQEADAMAHPADPLSLLETIKDTHAESKKPNITIDSA
jgi:uncharacterized membrane protein